MQLKKKTYLTELQFVKIKSDYFNGLKSIKLTYESLNKLRSGVSKALEKELISNIIKVESGWDLAQPLLQGSWSRKELCPYSDLDILFLGDASDVLKTAEVLKTYQFKLMYRIPQDSNDWTMGVEPYDVFAYFYARATDKKAGGAEEIDRQKEKAVSFLNRAEIKSQLAVEKSVRSSRYETVINYLEPNIKYSPGGLRDIQQSLDLLLISKDDFTDYRDKLLYFKELFLVIRQFLHFEGYNDILVAEAQQELYSLLGFDSLQELMKEVHIALNESFFISKIVSAEIFLNEETLKVKPVKKIREAIEQINKDSSLSSQYFIKNTLSDLVRDNSNYIFLKELLSSKLSADSLRSYFNAEVFHFIEPELERVKGWVQHDQYHKFCLDQHLLNSICAVADMKSHPKGKVGNLSIKLKAEDWGILMFAALYHDIGKGRKGDHSNVGADYFLSISGYLKIEKTTIEEIEWIIRNHLLVSKLAFKKNSSSSEAVAEMVENKLNPERLMRLIVFTAIDIIATNPEAWDEWKDKALSQLWLGYHQKESRALAVVLASLPKEDRDLFKSLAPKALTGVDKDWLLADLQSLKNKKISEVMIFKGEEGQLWLRYYNESNQKGVALKAIKLLYALGVSVRQASFGSISYLEKVSAYNWFSVETSQSEDQLLNKLNHINLTKINIPKVNFDSVSLVSRGSQLATISFKGSDQPGALLSAINDIYKADLDIVRAQVSTWGERVDDIFTVKISSSLDVFLSSYNQSK